MSTPPLWRDFLGFLWEGRWWWLTLLVTLVAGVLLVAWLTRTARRDWRTALPLSLVIGGAVGNLVDRLHAAQVTDFIDVQFGHWHYPVFNLADCGITVGAVLLVAFGLFGGKGQGGVR